MSLLTAIIFMILIKVLIYCTLCIVKSYLTCLKFLIIIYNKITPCVPYKMQQKGKEKIVGLKLPFTLLETSTASIECVRIV